MLLKEVVDGVLGPSLEVGEFAGRIAFPNFMAMTLSGLAVALIEMVHGSVTGGIAESWLHVPLIEGGLNLCPAKLKTIS